MVKIRGKLTNGRRFVAVAKDLGLRKNNMVTTKFTMQGKTFYSRIDVAIITESKDGLADRLAEDIATLESHDVDVTTIEFS